jgi:hypothetical protein
MARSRLLHWLTWLASGRAVGTPPSDTEPRRDEPDDEARLATYVRRIGVLDERPQKADAAELAALSRLVQAGNLAAATRLGAALASALPTDDTLQLRVAELLVRQGLYAAAAPLLQRVVASPTADSLAIRARALRVELAAESGQTAAACAELTQLLADDFHHPGARQRLASLRGKLGAISGAPGDTGGATLHAAMSAAPTLLGAGSSPGTRYRLHKEPGSGKSGTVYLADDAELGCAVALKLFHPQRVDGTRPREAAPALREARLLSSLHHPGVLFLYELEPEGRYLTMELCEGGSLRARLSTGRLPLPIALRRAVEVCDTLRAVHALSIAHGDVKPENLLFRGPARSLLEAGVDPPFGDLVLGDFGVGIDASAELPPSESAAGTRAYLPPERLRGAPPSAAADLYAFGVVLEELLQKEATPLPLRALIEQLRSQDAAARPTAQAALSVLRQIFAATENR